VAKGIQIGLPREWRGFCEEGVAVEEGCYVWCCSGS